MASSSVLRDSEGRVVKYYSLSEKDRDDPEKVLEAFRECPSGKELTPTYEFGRCSKRIMGMVWHLQGDMQMSLGEGLTIIARKEKEYSSNSGKVADDRVEESDLKNAALSRRKLLMHYCGLSLEDTDEHMEVMDRVDEHKKKVLYASMSDVMTSVAEVIFSNPLENRFYRFNSDSPTKEELLAQKPKGADVERALQRIKDVKASIATKGKARTM